MKQYRLIIADDEKLIRESLAGFIDWNSLGFELVLLAEDGQEVIDGMKSLKPDVVLTDIRMRRTSGLSVAEYAANNFPDMVLVLLSGYREFEYAKKAISFGVDEYLLKPISISAIHTTFEKIREKLVERDREVEKKKEMKETLRTYKQAAIEKLMEFGRMGVLTEEGCLSYMDRFGMTLMKDNVICYEAELSTEHCGDYDMLLADILANLFNMVAEQYGFYHVYVFYKDGKNDYRIVVTMDSHTEPFNEDKWVEEMEQDIYEICHSRAQLHLVKKRVPFVAYIVDSKKEMPDFGMSFSASRQENPDAWIQAVSKQCLMILNMAIELDEVSDGIWNTLGESLTGMKVSEQTERMNRIFSNIRCEVERLYKGGTSRKWSDLLLVGNSREYFDRNIREIWDALREEKGITLSVVEQAKRLIEENITGDISLKQTADSVYLSPNYFCRIFREQSGENFNEYCIRIKMEKASQMLRETRYKVYEISEYLGYKNIKYFYKLFKRVYNVTPTEYRERSRKGDI